MVGWMGTDGLMDGWMELLLSLTLFHSSINFFLGAELKKSAACCHRKSLPVFHCLDLYIQVQPCCSEPGSLPFFEIATKINGVP